MTATVNINICQKALTGTCNKYDSFEPEQKCITSYGASCKDNKPITCSQCGHYKRMPPCTIGYFSTAKTTACNQAVSKLDFYRSGY